jgi:cytochrome c5
MSGISDRDFLRLFSMLVGGLAALTFVLFVLAQIVGGLIKKESPAQLRAKAAQEQAVAARIQPVGQLMLAGGAGDKVIQTLLPAAQAAEGKSVYDTACQVCHAAGVAGAPKFGDKAAWKDRIAQGMNTLYEHALKGFQGKVGFMPAKGGNAALPDADVKAAVDYMVKAAK